MFISVTRGAIFLSVLLYLKHKQMTHEQLLHYSGGRSDPNGLDIQFCNRGNVTAGGSTV